MSAETGSKKSRSSLTRNGLGWSIFASPIIVPLAFTAGILSAPFSRSKMQRREEAFRAQMKASNRTIEWTEFAKAMEDDLGTPIEERYSLQGPVRWWWAPDDIREHSPYSYADWASMLKDEKYAPFSKWCNERYIHPETGSALLVCPPRDKDKKSLAAQAKNLKSKSNRWMDAVPPEILAQKQSPSKTTPNL